MRSFHTHTQSETTGSFGSDLIGRSTGQFVPSQIKKKALPATNLEKRAGYSSRSKLEVMADNLRDGLQYVRKQTDNLEAIDLTVGLLRDEYRKKTSFHTSPVSRLRPEILLHHQALNNLSSETLFGHPLFGYGFENPIRIHLKLGNLTKAHSIPISPLLSSHPLRALLASSRWMEPPGQGLFESLGVDLMNFLLTAKKEEDALDRQIQELLEYGYGRSRLPAPQNSSRPKVTERFPSRLLRRFITTLTPGRLHT
jgi:hypothetical protein